MNSLIINRKAQNLRTNVRLNTSLTVTLQILQVEIIHDLTRRRREKEGNTTTMGMAISLVQMAEERVPKKYPHLGCTTEKGSGECFFPPRNKPSLLRKWTRHDKQPSQKSHPTLALPWRTELLWLTVNFNCYISWQQNYTENKLLEVWKLDPIHYCKTCSNFLLIHSKKHLALQETMSIFLQISSQGAANTPNSRLTVSLENLKPKKIIFHFTYLPA